MLKIKLFYDAKENVYIIAAAVKKILHQWWCSMFTDPGYLFQNVIGDQWLGVTSSKQWLKVKTWGLIPRLKSEIMQQWGLKMSTCESANPSNLEISARMALQSNAE